MCGAQFLVVPVGVEVNGIRPHMVEDTVEDDPNPSFLCLIDQLLEGFFVSEHLVDGHIVSGIIFMVASCLEDRIQVDSANA